MLRPPCTLHRSERPRPGIPCPGGRFFGSRRRRLARLKGDVRSLPGRAWCRTCQPTTRSGSMPLRSPGAPSRHIGETEIARPISLLKIGDEVWKCWAWQEKANSMIYPRYIVFDDAPQDRRLGCTADQFADALRSPLAAVGVRVVRKHGAESASPHAGLQVRGWSRKQYNAQLNTVTQIVDGVVKSLATKN
jgi:hypothetical protein